MKYKPLLLARKCDKLTIGCVIDVDEEIVNVLIYNELNSFVLSVYGLSDIIQQMGFQKGHEFPLKPTN